MSNDQKQNAPSSGLAKTRATAVATGVEVCVVFGAILLYIWRWQHTLAWTVILAVIFASHFFHRDSPRSLGVTLAGLRPSAEWLLPIAVVLYLPLLAIGFSRHVLVLMRPTWPSVIALFGYGIWCAAQQYLTQSYFHNRLALIIDKVHLRSVVVGILFAAAHLPNPILTGATFIAGTILAEAFARNRNIWPLAFAQAVGGLLLAAVVPDAWIHHMRVGPGFYF